MERLTVFTPTYNRANLINRVYESLLKQTYKDFVWMVVDDGSVDETREIIDNFKKENKIRIEYYYQENQGKHIATNRALERTDSELFIIADSDDAFVPNAFEILIDAWDGIPEKQKIFFKGVNCRVFNHETGIAAGKEFPYEIFDTTDEIAYFKYKMRSEKWNLVRTDVFKEYKFPEIKNAHFYPETVTWQLMSRKYKTRFINVPLREYFNDAENSIIFGGKSIRYVENIHLWTHFINNELKYFFYYPKRFIQSFIGLIRDGLLNNYSLRKIFSIPKGVLRKLLCVMFLPIGWMMFFTYKRNIKV